jgi:adenosylmethionine-8-amino-7-oxononanoate aminotransferase
MDSILKRDKNIIWHPFTQEKTAGPLIAIKKGAGSYLYDQDDNSYLDLISSWWVNLHGHGHPKIANSIYEQAMHLEHVIFAGFTHEPAVKLCENLQKLLPKPLEKFFFSDNGSTAVEVALKMAYQYWQNKNQSQKTLFLSFEGGYHGDTFGAMSVGNKSGFHDTFKDLFFKVISIPYPHTWENDIEVETKEENALKALDNHLMQNAHKIAAIILEPLIQGASGMRICRPIFIQNVVERMRKYGILVIFDEVMTGFGRTGNLFALEQTNVVPDFLCLSKGITGGFLPLALTVTTTNVYNAFLHDETKYSFSHGHSYTANPIACAAAIASLDILLSPETTCAIDSLNKAHRSGIAYLKKHCKNINKTRVLGTIAAFELAFAPNLKQLKTMFLAEGLLIRPLGNTIYLMPPYCTTTAELATAYKKIAKIIQSKFHKH